MIRTDFSNSFAHDTMKRRVPNTIRDVQHMNPDYPAAIQEALDKLHDEIQNDAPIRMLDPLAPDYDLWAASYAPYEGSTWLNTHWFFAETFFYRHLIQAVRWWETGRDPFAPKKVAELASAELWSLLGQALQTRSAAAAERLLALIHYDLWGNRIDLSFAASLAHGGAGTHDDLLVNDDEAIVHHLLKQRGAVHIIVDNTGTELALDLALIDALLDCCADQVILHVKMHPTFVSDATPPDVITLLNAMCDGTHRDPICQLGERLHGALEASRLRLAPDFYWNSSRLLWDMPVRLMRIFERAALVIIKGDANYRRMVGDALWAAHTPFSTVTDFFPAPLLALRTMKSDAVVGLPTGLAETLDGIDPRWRVNGRRGVIQFKGK
jgi:hypothetical protein